MPNSVRKSSRARVSFVDAYSTHCSELESAVAKHSFEKVESIVQMFWSEAGDKRGDVESDACLAKAAEVRLEDDAKLYTNIVNRLFPDVFINMSQSLTKDIRRFAKTYYPMLTSAIAALPANFREARLKSADAFSQKLRRYTSLNHLAKAARDVLSKPTHGAKMQEDYGRIDFVTVQDQMSWVCEGCDPTLMSTHEEAFRQFHKQEDSLEKWAEWLQGIVADWFGANPDSAQIAERGSELLLRWSFISSLIIRDLTLRSASSFGPFHLMRLLCDEYMYYLVETTIAEGRCRPIKHAAEPSNPGLEAADASQALADADAGNPTAMPTGLEGAQLGPAKRAADGEPEDSAIAPLTKRAKVDG